MTEVEKLRRRVKFLEAELESVRGLYQVQCRQNQGLGQDIDRLMGRLAAILATVGEVRVDDATLVAGNLVGRVTRVRDHLRNQTIFKLKGNDKKL
jgi:hypothetical protein